MKINKLLPILMAVLFSMMLLSGCMTFPLQGNLVMGNVYTLKSGQTLDDDLTVMGGVANIEQDAKVNGDLAVMGGSVAVDGEIAGDISVLGGSVNLGKNAVVRGEISQFGGSVTQRDGAVVQGGSSDTPPTAPMRAPRLSINLDPILEPFFAFFRALGMAALAVLLSLFALRPMQRISDAVVAQPIVTGGIGLLTLVVAPALVVVLAITIILLPISLIGVLLLGICVIFGWLALGLLLGRQIAVWTRQSWSDAISAGVGTLALSLAGSLMNAIPCVGWIATALIAMMGVGAVLLTRFGTQVYPAPAAYAAPYPVQTPLRPVAPPAAPVQPLDPTPADLFADLDDGELPPDEEEADSSNR